VATARRTKKTTKAKTTSQPSASAADLENKPTETADENQTALEVPESNTEEAAKEAPAKVKIDREQRAAQWEMLTPKERDRLQLTREEFLTREDVTGFGANSYFTPLEERRVGQPTNKAGD
jgi:hypothetical protein